jgi:hypothetical protein
VHQALRDLHHSGIPCAIYREEDPDIPRFGWEPPKFRYVTGVDVDYVNAFALPHLTVLIEKGKETCYKSIWDKVGRCVSETPMRRQFAGPTCMAIQNAILVESALLNAGASTFWLGVEGAPNWLLTDYPSAHVSEWMVPRLLDVDEASRGLSQGHASVTEWVEHFRMSLARFQFHHRAILTFLTRLSARLGALAATDKAGVIMSLAAEYGAGELTIAPNLERRPVRVETQQEAITL